jgi:hypothetical protein
MKLYLLTAIQLASAALLQFSPPGQLVLDDYSFDNKFDIKLTSKPTGNVVVFYAAPNLSFRDVYKTFTPDNWNVSQSVYVRGSTQFTAANTQTYALSAKLFPANGAAVTETYTVQRKVALGGKCT